MPDPTNEALASVATEMQRLFDSIETAVETFEDDMMNSEVDAAVICLNQIEEDAGNLAGIAVDLRRLLHTWQQENV